MEREKFDLGREIRVVPAWAVVLAVLVFLGIQFVFFRFAWASEPNAPPLPLQIVLTTMAGTALAFLVLLVGYVNRDAGRRGMNRTLWTLIVIFVPNAIGFIIYFVVRHPLRLRCPQCGTMVDSQVNYCPSCQFGLRRACLQCKSAVDPNDRFCPKCGLEQETSSAQTRS
ncbi:MAG: zinc ribbon domain-containing protein [Planctomycetaceae bacterium]|nr:MAG: zinc ribbon domain-containing protein [Planctomycetaceae bacterium]